MSHFVNEFHSTFPYIDYDLNENGEYGDCEDNKEEVKKQKINIQIEFADTDEFNAKYGITIKQLKRNLINMRKYKAFQYHLSISIVANKKGIKVMYIKEGMFFLNQLTEIMATPLDKKTNKDIYGNKQTIFINMDLFAFKKLVNDKEPELYKLLVEYANLVDINKEYRKLGKNKLINVLANEDLQDVDIENKDIIEKELFYKAIEEKLMFLNVIKKSHTYKQDFYLQKYFRLLNNWD